MEEINFPPDVRKMLFVLIGEMPLQARENLLYASRELYSFYGKNLTKLRDTARDTIQKSRDSLPPAVAEQYVQGLTMLIGEGRGNDPVQRVLDQITDLENRQIDLSQNVQGAKWEIIAEIIMLIAELAILTALMAFTGGASVSQIFLARARSRFAVLMIIDRLLTMTHIMPTLTEAVTEALQTLAVRLAQIALNSGRRKPDGIDWGDVGKAAAFGAVVGLFGSVFEWVAKPFKSIFKDFNADVLDKFKFNPNNLNYKLLKNGPPEIVGAFVIAGAAEGLGEYVVTGAFEGNWDFKWETFVGSGSSAVFELGASAALGGAGLWAYNKYFDNKHTFTEINDLSGSSGGGAGGSSGGGRGNSGGGYGGSAPASAVTGGPSILPGPGPSTSYTPPPTTSNRTITPTPSTASAAPDVPTATSASPRTYNPPTYNSPSGSTTSSSRSDLIDTATDIESVLNPASPLPMTSSTTGDFTDASGLRLPKPSLAPTGSVDTDSAITPTDFGDPEFSGSDTSSYDPDVITPADPVSTATGPSHTPGLGTGGGTRQPTPEIVTAARDEHADAMRAVTEANAKAETIRQRVETGVGSSRDADALTRATADVQKAESHLAQTEEHLRELGIDPHAPEPQGPDDQHVPVVRRDEAQRQWIADRITPADLPAELTAGSSDPTGLSDLDRVKSQMVQPGSWSPELDTTAANATRRIWQDAYADFVDAVPDDVRDNAGQAWSTATSLVLPLELHPVLADSRHALESYRSAVRQVADVLVTGGGREAATTLADRLRHGLDLPARLRGGATGSTPGEPAAVPTAGDSASRPGHQPSDPGGHPSDSDEASSESSDSSDSEADSDAENDSENESENDSEDEPTTVPPPRRPPTSSGPAHQPDDSDSESEDESEEESDSEADEPGESDSDDESSDDDAEDDSDDDSDAGLAAMPVRGGPANPPGRANAVPTASAHRSAPSVPEPPEFRPAPVSAEDLERLRYQSEAEQFESRLADFLSEHPDVTAEVKRFVALLWEKTPQVMRPMLGSLDSSVPGSVGRSLGALEEVVQNGNFREQTVLLWNALRYHVFDSLHGTRKNYPPVIAADRRWRGTPSDGLPERDPETARPPLSRAERDFSTNGTDWITGAERSGISHRPPAAEPTDERPLTVEDSPHYAAQSTGALLMTGLSGTAYFWLNAVEAANKQWDAGLDLGLMRLALVGTLLANRHHSLHEVLTATELWASEEAHPERHGLDFAYDDSWDRYHNLQPLSEQELRDNVAVGGRFPSERVREFYQGGTSGGPSRSAVPRLSDLLLQGSWWRLFIDPNVHDEVFAPKPEDIGGHLDRTKYPGYRKGMTELYAEVLDGGSGDRDWSRIDVDAYEEMHDLATRHLTDGGQNRSTTWSGSSMVTHRGTGVESLAADVVEETVLGRPLLVDFNAQRPGGPKPMMVFWLGGRVSSNYTVDEARAAVQELLDRYYDEVAVALGPDDKLRAVARVTRALQILQPFTDANSRVNVHTLMQKFLLEQGFRPAVLMNSHSLFLGGFSVPEIVAHLKDGMALFDQHLRWARWDGFNQFGGPRDTRLVDTLAQGMGLTGDAPAELRRRVVDTVRTARAMFGDEIPGDDQAGQTRWLGAFQRLRDTAGTLFPELSGPDAVSEYVARVYELGPEDDLFDEHVLATVESVASLPADGTPLDMSAVREHLPDLPDDEAQSENAEATAEPGPDAGVDDESEEESEEDSDDESDDESDPGDDSDSDDEPNSDDDSDSDDGPPPLPQTVFHPGAPAPDPGPAPETRGAPAAEAPLLLPSMAFDPKSGPGGRQRGGLRGGSRDNGVDPLASRWAVGRSVTLMAPRHAAEGETVPTRVPVASVPVPEGKGKSTPQENWFPVTLREPSNPSDPLDPSDSESVRSGSSGSSDAARPGYEVSDMGRVRLPDGQELDAEGWVGFGDDFVQLPSGAYLRGDSGWIGRVDNIEALRQVLDELDPDTTPYTLVANRSSGVYLTPADTGTQAVRLPLDHKDDETPEMPDPPDPPDPSDPSDPSEQKTQGTGRDPVLDPGMSAPPTGRRTPARLDDGRTMPAYVDDLEALLPDDLTDAERSQLLAGPSTFGQSAVLLRGIDQVVARIREELGRRPGVRPRDQAQLSADVARTLREKPKSLADGGRPIPYVNEDGTLRVLHIKARHRGGWTPFDDGIGHAAKLDSMHQAAAVFGFTKNVQSNTQYGTGGPLGPVGSAAYGGYGRLAFRFGFIDKVGYTLTDQRQNQTESRTLDDSRTYLDDLHYEVWVVDAAGQLVTDSHTDTETETAQSTAQDAQVVPSRFAFGIRNGIQVRLPDSVTKVGEPGRIPRSLDLGRDTQYRFVSVEGYGPVAAIRDWAASLLGVLPGSSAYRELDAFFSGDSFQRHSATMARGRLTTPPLYADDKNKSPLGVFVVEEVIPRSAVLFGETDMAEIRDSSSSTVRSERFRTKGRNIVLQAAAGPAFNFFDPGLAPFDLRLQFGPNAQYSFNRSRAGGLGGSGALKAVGQVKGPKTALYVVVKSVRVRRSGDTGPPTQFLTWSLDRLTSAEARRLADWDDGTALVVRHGAVPYAPAYLSVDWPRTLGMHRVKEFTFEDGRRTQVVPDSHDGVGRTLLDAFADSVVDAVAARRRGLVVPLHELDLPKGWRARFHDLIRRDPDRLAAEARDLPVPPRWRNNKHYHAALQNTLQILGVLSQQNVTGSLEALTTVGLRVRLSDPGSVGQTYYTVWVHGTLSGRQYEGKDITDGIRFSAQGAERLDGQVTARRAAEAGFEGTLSGRDNNVDDTGRRLNTLGLSLGARKGWQREAESGFGSTVTAEPMSVSKSPADLYRYTLDLTATLGGYWRPRGLIRGFGFGLPGLLVLDEPTDILFGRTSLGFLKGGGPVRGQVLISVPVQHAPEADPHADGALNPYLAAEPEPVAMSTERALALAKGDLVLPGGAGGNDRLAARGTDQFRELRQHPYAIVNAVLTPGLVAAVDGVLRRASGSTWHLVKEGAPVREAVIRVFTPQYLTANFDQSSGPLGLMGSGLLGKGPATALWGTYRYATSVSGLNLLTGPWPMDTELALGATRVASGKVTKVTTFVFGGQLGYNAVRSPGHGLMGVYGLIAHPVSTSRASATTVVRTVVADVNRASSVHQVLVTGDVRHWFALTTSRLGTGRLGRAAAGSALVPSILAGAAGMELDTPAGMLAHLPEKSAHRMGLIDDGLGDVPRYARHRWAPQPWLAGAPFGTYAVNSLDPTAALLAFERRLDGSGLDEASREKIRQLVTARATRALKGEMTTTGPSAMVSVRGSGWGSVRIGRRSVRVRVELIAGTPEFQGLDHGSEIEDNRRASEVVLTSSEASSGTDLGIVTGQVAHTDNPSIVGAGPTYTEAGTHRQTVASSHSNTTVTIYRAVTTEPHAEIVTPYTMRITLEADDTPHQGDPSGREADEGTTTALDRFLGRHRIVEEHGVGDLREHVPLSLMEPTSTGPRRALPAPDPRTDPALTRAPRPTPLPAVRKEIRVVHGDGVERPFTFPENGFHPRGILGVDTIRTANDLLLTRAYDAGFSLAVLQSENGPDDAALTQLLRQTQKSGLTRTGTGSAQALEDATSLMAVTSFYPRTLEPAGYQIAGLTEKSFLGSDSGELSLHSTPDFSRALLLTVTDGARLEVLHQSGEAAATALADEHTQSGHLGAGFLYDASQDIGLNQIGLLGGGPHALDADTGPTADDHLSSRNLKPKTPRVFLFAIPTRFVGVGDVHRTFKDSRAMTYLRGTFGHARPGAQAMESQAYVVAWVREDVARELMLITDSNFPESARKAWDAVGEASQGWVAADTAYWAKRRTAIHLRDAVRAAETAATDTRNRLNPLLDAAESADTALEQAESDARTDHDTARRLTEAADALDRTDTGLRTARETARTDRAHAQDLVRTAQDTLDMLPGWSELPGNELGPEQFQQATDELDAARRRADELRDAADRAVAAAQLARDNAEARLATLEQEADPSTTPMPAADADRARHTAARLVETADRRLARARSRQTTANGRLTAPARAHAAATERLKAARDAFEARRQELALLRAAADTAAAEYHRVRAAADQLTRWHRLAATESGRNELDGLTQPPEVSYQPPPQPAPEPTPERPRYTRDATGPDTRLVSPAQETYVLVDVPRDGDAFFHALLRGLDGAAPDLLADVGIDPAGPDAVPALRRRLAARLTDPADVDLLAFMTPDDTDTFSARDLDDAGLDLGNDTPARREFDALGFIPHAADLSADARAGLAVAQLLRRGDADSERGWNHSAADLLPMLAARTFGVRITVVREDGSFDHYDPDSGPQPAGGTTRSARRGLRGLVDDADRPRPQMILSLTDRHYQVARPAGLTAPADDKQPTDRTKALPPPKADGANTAQTEPESSDQTEPEPSDRTGPVPPPVSPGSSGPSGRRIDADDRSFSVRPVPGDGDCLFRAVLDSMAAQHPGRRAPGSATALQGVRGRLADWYADSADAADLRALHASQDPLEALVADLFPHLDDLQDLLGLSTAPRLTDEQRDRIARRLTQEQRKADLRALAADERERELLSGFPAAAVAQLLPPATADPWQTDPARARRLSRQAQADTLRADVLNLLRAPAGGRRADAVWRRIRAALPPEARAHVPSSLRAFTAMGYGDLVARSLASPALWHTPFYDDAPVLLSRWLGVRLVLVQPGGNGGHTVMDLAPDATGPTVHVHYNGRDHYEALVPVAADASGSSPDPRPRQQDERTAQPTLSAQDRTTRDRLAALLRRHGVDDADARRLTAGLTASTLARLRSAAQDSGALDAGAGVPPVSQETTDHRDPAGDEARSTAPPVPVWSPEGVLTLNGTPFQLPEVPGEGDRFTEALVHALRTGLPHAGRQGGALLAALTAEGGPDALHHWAEQRLATPGAAESAPLLAGPEWHGGLQELATQDLARAGVRLNAEQSVFVELGGTALPVAELDVSLPQRYRLLRQTAHRGPLTETIAELIAQELGVRLTIIEQDGRVRLFGPLNGTVIVLARVGGVYRPAVAPTR